MAKPLTKLVVEYEDFERRRWGVRSAITQVSQKAANAVRNMAREYIVEWDAIVTGNLWNSVGVNYLNGGGAEVFASEDYAQFIHDGTRRMAARPFLTQALADYQPQLEKDIKEIIEIKGPARG